MTHPSLSALRFCIHCRWIPREVADHLLSCQLCAADLVLVIPDDMEGEVHGPDAVYLVEFLRHLGHPTFWREEPVN